MSLSSSSEESPLVGRSSPLMARPARPVVVPVLPPLGTVGQKSPPKSPSSPAMPLSPTAKALDSLHLSAVDLKGVACTDGGEVDIEGIPEEQWNIEFRDLVVEKELAEGTFGRVYLGTYFGTPVAIKLLFQVDVVDNIGKYILRELAMLRAVGHPNIIQFLGLCKHQDDVFVVTEFVDRVTRARAGRTQLRSLLTLAFPPVQGDLMEIIYNEHNAPLSWPLRVHLMVELCKPIAYLHGRGIVHRDIKLENALVDKSWTLKLCDFGFARMMHNQVHQGRHGLRSRKMTIAGTDQWMAPEVLMQQAYNDRADIFSLGCTFYELVARKQPPYRTPATKYQFDVQEFLGLVPKSTPKEVVLLILDMVQFIPSQRPSARQVLERLRKLQKELPPVDLTERPSTSQPMSSVSGASDSPRTSSEDQRSSDGTDSSEIAASLRAMGTSMDHIPPHIRRALSAGDVFLTSDPLDAPTLTRSPSQTERASRTSMEAAKAAAAASTSHDDAGSARSTSSVTDVHRADLGPVVLGVGAAARAGGKDVASLSLQVRRAFVAPKDIQHCPIEGPVFVTHSGNSSSHRYYCMLSIEGTIYMFKSNRRTEISRKRIVLDHASVIRHEHADTLRVSSPVHPGIFWLMDLRSAKAADKWFALLSGCVARSDMHFHARVKSGQPFGWSPATRDTTGNVLPCCFTLALIEPLQQSVVLVVADLRLRVLQPYTEEIIFEWPFASVAAYSLEPGAKISLVVALSEEEVRWFGTVLKTKGNTRAFVFHSPTDCNAVYGALEEAWEQAKAENDRQWKELVDRVGGGDRDAAGSPALGSLFGSRDGNLKLSSERAGRGGDGRKSPNKDQLSPKSRDSAKPITKSAEALAVGDITGGGGGGGGEGTVSPVVRHRLKALHSRRASWNLGKSSFSRSSSSSNLEAGGGRRGSNQEEELVPPDVVSKASVAAAIQASPRKRSTTSGAKVNAASTGKPVGFLQRVVGVGRVDESSKRTSPDKKVGDNKK